MSATVSLPEWLPLLAAAGSALVMYVLARRMMRGMNQQDWILLRQTRARGVDLTSPQRVDFIVFAATEETAADLAGKMRLEGFDTHIKPAEIQFARNKKKPGAPQGGWLITGTRVVRIVPEELSGTRKVLTEMSLAQKALYLGWQVSSEPAEPQPASPRS